MRITTGGRAACSILYFLHKFETNGLWSPSLWQGIYVCIGPIVAGKVTGLFRKRFALGAIITKLEFRLNFAAQSAGVSKLLSGDLSEFPQALARIATTSVSEVSGDLTGIKEAR